MADTIVLYSTPNHLNSTLILGKFTATYHPSIPIIILCNAPESAAASVANSPSITFRRLPDPTLPPDFTTDNVERFFAIPVIQKQVLHEVLLEISQKSIIRAFVIDFFCNAAFEVAGILNLPTYYYVSSGGFTTCVFMYLDIIHETIPQDLGNLNDYVEFPGCPKIYSSEIPLGLHFRQTNAYKHFLSSGINMRKSKGVIINSFDALEFKAKEALEQDLCTPNAKTPPVYFIGPLIAEGFLERTKDRGFVLESWAPQREILSHDSVAGFITHCGRSSVLESVSIGVPLICWPLYAEQKMNCVFVVEAMKAGLPLEMDADGFVTASELKKVIGELYESEKGRKLRERSVELKKATAAAVVTGGSSVVDLERFLDSTLD